MAIALVPHDHIKSEGHELPEKCVGIFQVIVPNFIDDITEKLGHTSLGCLVTGVVLELGFMGSLHTNLKNR